MRDFRGFMAWFEGWRVRVGLGFVLRRLLDLSCGTCSRRDGWVEGCGRLVAMLESIGVIKHSQDVRAGLMTRQGMEFIFMFREKVEVRSSLGKSRWGRKAWRFLAH